MQQHAQLTLLKPLFFEVPLLESDPLFTGRHWLLQELKSVVEGSSPGALISGSPGSGKTALILKLVDHSCFGRKKAPKSKVESEIEEEHDEVDETSRLRVQQTNDKVCKRFLICIANNKLINHFTNNNFSTLDS